MWPQGWGPALGLGRGHWLGWVLLSPRQREPWEGLVGTGATEVVARREGRGPKAGACAWGCGERPSALPGGPK